MTSEKRSFTKVEKENFIKFLNQYYYASANSIKFIAPVLLGIFLLVAVIIYFTFDGNFYGIPLFLGVFSFIKLKSIKTPKINLDNLEIISENGGLSFRTDRGYIVKFKNMHAYNLNWEKCQSHGFSSEKEVKAEYVKLREDRNMIYILNINGTSDISLPLR